MEKMNHALDQVHRFQTEGIETMLSIPDLSVASMTPPEYVATGITLWVTFTMLDAIGAVDLLKEELRAVPERIKVVQEKHGETFDKCLGRIGETARHLSL